MAFFIIPFIRFEVAGTMGGSKYHSEAERVKKRMSSCLREKRRALEPPSPYFHTRWFWKQSAPSSSSSIRRA